MLTLGSMMLFFSLMAFITSPVQQFSNVVYLIFDAFAALERVQGIKDIPQEKKVFVGAEKLEQMKGKIECRNLTFGYRQHLPVLKNISCTIEPGELVALVGETGVGKTTLVHLLCGFYPPDSGEILVDDKNIQNVAIDSLRHNISFVPQRSHLFRDSIYHNITMGRDIPVEEIEKKIQNVEAFKFLDALPQKLYSPVFSGGSNFSSGQIQRISILRAIIEERPILIFDEATSNLDSVTEKAILDLLRQERAGKTTMIIGHRLSTIALTDKILVLFKGELVETGSFKELIAKKGVFYSLFQAQLEAEKNAK
jgi:ABC-type multidrug transport system fused ATPase/permease subunit